MIEMLANTGFETATGTADDNNEDTFAGWTISGSGGKIELTATARSGNNACKLTATGAYGNRQISQTVTVVPGATYLLTFWWRGDGTYGPQFYVVDASVSKYIYIAAFYALYTGTTWQFKEYAIRAPVGCTSLKVSWMISHINGGIGYVDDVSLKRLPIGGRVIGTNLIKGSR